MDMNTPQSWYKKQIPLPVSAGQKFASGQTIPASVKICSLTNKIINAIPDAIVVVDLDHRIIAINPAFTRQWGYSLEEIKGKSVRILYDRNEKFDCHDSRSYNFKTEDSPGKIHTHHYRRKDGTFFHGETQGSPVKDSYGTTIGYIGTTRPTDLIRQQSSLYKNEALLRLAFENASDAILWADPQKDAISNCNPAAEQLFQIDKKEIIGLPLASFSPPGRKHNLVRLRERPIGCNSMESDIITSVGETIPVRITASVIMIQEHPTIQYIFKNIRKEKEAEQAVKTATTDLEKKIRERTTELEETNTALKVLIKKGEKEREEFTQEIMNEITERIEPYLRKLKTTPLTSTQKKHVRKMEQNINDIVSPLNRSLAGSLRNLTPTEIKIAKHIIRGLRTKDIAEAMQLSPSTIDVHRRNIRKKYGINNRKMNLQTALSSIIK